MNLQLSDENDQQYSDQNADPHLSEQLRLQHRTDDSVMVFNSKEGKEHTNNNRKLIILVYISRIVPIMAVIFLFAYIIYLFANPDNWSTDQSVEDSEIIRRTTSRGQFVSLCIAALLNVIGAFMFYIKVRESLVVTNYGFILGPVTGFMLDQGIGTDAGFEIFMTTAGFSYTFSSLIGGNFMRYIVTVFLDLFISNPLQDILKTQIAKIGVLKALKNPDGKGWIKWRYDAFVAQNFPSILQSLVAVVTFNAYTNQTRFAWAYPENSFDREFRIPPGTIMLSSAIAGVLYLNFYTIMDYISDREYYDVNTKLFYVLFMLGLLYGLNQTESIEAPVEGEYDKEYTKSLGSAKPFLGIGLYACFVCYGLVYPVWTRLGCCGHCKSKESESEETDHLAEDGNDELLHLTQGMLEEIKVEVRKEVVQVLEKQNNVHLSVDYGGNNNDYKIAI